MAQPSRFDETQIRNSVRDFVINKFLIGTDSKQLGDNDSFLEHGIIDSTGVLELVGFIEETFKCRVEDEELIPDNLDTLANIVLYVRSKTNGQLPMA